MAMSTSWAQEVITCDLCPNATQQFCNNCQVKLCGDCVSTHVDKFKSLAHDIVHFTKRKIQLVFEECMFHSSKRCIANCQKCDVHVCLTCIQGPHYGHNIMNLHKIFYEKKQEIEKENQEIENIIIPKYEKKMNDTESKISITTDEFDELIKETEKQRKHWHQEVDTIFSKLGSLIKSMTEKYFIPLKSYQSKLKNLLPDMLQTVKQNKDILKTNRVSEFKNYKSKLKEYRDMHADIDVKVPSLNIKSVQGRELSIELGEYKATLTQTALSSLTDKVSYLSVKKLLDTVGVIATIPTGVKPLLGVACEGRDEAWVSGEDKIIKRVDLHGSVQESITITGIYCPNDISVTSQGELIYSDHGNKTVNIVRDGKIEALITTPLGWEPWGLCCTRSLDILVNVFKEKRNKILRYQGKMLKQEIYKKIKEGFDMLFMAENNNGDICVSDLNADILIVMEKKGKDRFQYTGTPVRREKSFSPRQIVTDSVSQIIVTDNNNACLHILVQNGQFLKFVDNCGLDQPYGLSMDSKGRLWIGLLDSGEVKVIQNM